MSWTEIEIDASGKVTVRRGGTLTGETESEPEQKADPEPEPKPKLVTWKLCVLILPECLGAHYVRWYPSGSIPNDWYPVEAHTQPIETVKQLPEGQVP